MTWRRDEQGRVSGKAYLTVVDDYEPVQKAITAMAEKTATGELDVFTAKSLQAGDDHESLVCRARLEAQTVVLRR